MFASACNSLRSPKVLCPAYTVGSTVFALFAEKVCREDFGTKKMTGVVVLNSALIFAQASTTSKKVREFSTMVALALSFLSMCHSVDVKTYCKELFSRPDPAFGTASTELEQALNEFETGSIENAINKGNVVTIGCFRKIVDVFNTKLEENRDQQAELTKKFEEIFFVLFDNSSPSLQTEKNKILHEIALDHKKGNEIASYTLYDFLTEEFTDEQKSEFVKKAVFNLLSILYYADWSIESFEQFVDEKEIELSTIYDKDDFLFDLLPYVLENVRQQDERNNQLREKYLRLQAVFKKHFSEEQIAQLARPANKEQNLYDAAHERGFTEEQCILMLDSLGVPPTLAKNPNG
ncbi:MAG: hypothetical protein SNF33_08155 [Candidatus Algichlamydia australiensis]|nr:hypothetical protein [Chlamydiales bacterium]